VIGLLVPIEAGMAIVLYIGLVIAAQAFEATPRKHAPAVALGLLPGLAQGLLEVILIVSPPPASSPAA